MSVQRKSSPSPTSPAAESDLETTAELPVLDVAAYEAATTEERLVNTDTWIIQSPLARESKERAPRRLRAPLPPLLELLPLRVLPMRVALWTTGASMTIGALTTKSAPHLEASLHALSDNLREVEERLKRKGERLAEIEQALVLANTERAVAEQHTQQLNAELAKARSAMAVAEARVSGLQKTLDEREAVNQTLRSHDDAVRGEARAARQGAGSRAAGSHRRT